MTTTDGGGAIAQLEAELDGHLPSTRLDGPHSPALHAAAARWADLVWQTAVARGPLPLDADTITRGLDLVRRPVFVCGVHRSGTTLLRDLLDGHPSLLVLPSEGTFLQSSAVSLAGRPAHERVGVLGREWLRRLANPINQPPYWLLGRTNGEESGSIQFAQALLAWWPLVEGSFSAHAETWPIAAVVLAYGSASAQPAAWMHITRWVEKTPTNEQHVEQLRREWPEARIVQVIRHPLEVFASRRALEERTHGRFQAAAGVLRDLRASYEIARAEVAHRRGDYQLVRYEELVGSAPEVMRRLAEALDVEMTPTLLEPTVAGRPAAPNSSFRDAAGAGEIVSPVAHASERLTTAERDLVVAVAGEPAAALGYALEPMSRWRATLIRLRSGIW